MTQDGARPFAKFFKALKDERAKALIRTRIRRIEESGNFGDHKSVGSGVFELRIDHGPGYRIYYAQRAADKTLVLLGGTKARQEADIAKAKRLWSAAQDEMLED